MKKAMYGAVTVGVALMLAVPVFAQQPVAAEPSVRAKAQEVREAARAKTEEAREAAREAVRREVGAIREAAKELREGRTEEAVEKLREGVKAAGEKVREARQAERVTLREELLKEREAVKVKIEANRKALQAKLKTIKDEKKRGVVETLAGKFNTLNTGRVEHFGEALDKLGGVLGRISDRSAKAKTLGKDAAPVEAAIAAAQKAIDDARAAVKTQAGKVYKVTVTEETKLKDDLSKVRDAYKADVKAVEEKVRAARQAVHNAATTLAGIPGIGELKEAPAPAPAPAAVPAPAAQPATTNP